MGETLSVESKLTVFDNLAELSEQTQVLVRKAKEAALVAYAKYSDFQVGAAVLLDNDTIIIGNNQENASYPAGLCAERVAFFAAKSQFPESSIKAVAVVAKRGQDDHFKAVTPCGICRQVMAEYEDNQETPIELYMTGSNGKILRSESIENLMPFKFSKTSLSSDNGRASH